MKLAEKKPVAMDALAEADGLAPDPMDDPTTRAQIIQELKDRVAYADSPDAEFLSHAEVKKKLGL